MWLTHNVAFSSLSCDKIDLKSQSSFTSFHAENKRWLTLLLQLVQGTVKKICKTILM